MTSIATTEDPKPARRRSQRSLDAIHAATLALLEEGGYRAATIEGIAARAGVGKQTIYRWWPSRAALVMEAYEARVVGREERPDTGSLRDDVSMLVMHVGRVFESTEAGGVVTSLAAEAYRDQDMRTAFRHGFMERRRANLRAILQRGQQRGQLAEDSDLELLIDALYGPILFRALMSTGGFDRAEAERLTDIVLGLAP